VKTLLVLIGVAVLVAWFDDHRAKRAARRAGKDRAK
jgi:hypothetical protein